MCIQKPITTREMLKIAKTKFTDPILRHFKQRFVIAYSSPGLKLNEILKGGEKTIVNDCLITKNSWGDNFISLHPIVIEILKSTEYQTTSISHRNAYAYIKQIALEAGITGSFILPSGHRKYRYQFLYPNQLRECAEEHQNKFRFSYVLQNVLTISRSPEDRNEHNSELEELFKNPFYDCLKYVASDHLQRRPA